MTHPPDNTISVPVPAGAGREYFAARIAAVLKGERARKPRKPTLVSAAKQARKAGIDVARYEIRPDNTIVIVTGKPESAEAENPWSLDEFRTKETKQ